MLGLLAFILAFTSGMTASRLDDRRQLLLQESNAIGTTDLRAGLLPQRQRDNIRRLLREYADVRLKGTVANIAETLAQSEQLHRRLWSQAESLVQADMDSELRLLFITSLNEVIDLHQSRKTVGLLYRIPAMVALGSQVGMSGSRWLRGMPVLVAAFSLVIVMIADIDRPGEGNIRVSQQPLADVRQMMPQDAP